MSTCGKTWGALESAMIETRREEDECVVKDGIDNESRLELEEAKAFLESCLVSSTKDSTTKKKPRKKRVSSADPRLKRMDASMKRAWFGANTGERKVLESKKHFYNRLSPDDKMEWLHGDREKRDKLECKVKLELMRVREAHRKKGK